MVCQVAVSLLHALFKISNNICWDGAFGKLVLGGIMEGYIIAKGFVGPLLDHG